MLGSSPLHGPLRLPMELGRGLKQELDKRGMHAVNAVDVAVHSHLLLP